MPRSRNEKQRRKFGKGKCMKSVNIVFLTFFQWTNDHGSTKSKGISIFSYQREAIPVGERGAAMKRRRDASSWFCQEIGIFAHLEWRTLQFQQRVGYWHSLIAQRRRSPCLIYTFLVTQWKLLNRGLRLASRRKIEFSLGQKNDIYLTNELTAGITTDRELVACSAGANSTWIRDDIFGKSRSKDRRSSKGVSPSSRGPLYIWDLQHENRH